MRKRKFNCQRPKSIRLAFLSVVAATLIISSVTGCSKLQTPGLRDFGSTGFEAIQQPETFAPKQRSIEEVLADQAAVTAAAERRNRFAEAVKNDAAEAQTEIEAKSDTATIAQTSFESEIEPEVETKVPFDPIVTPETKAESKTIAQSESPSTNSSVNETTSSPNLDVKLFAQVDDPKDASRISERLVGSGSTTNLLRPIEQSTSNEKTESQANQFSEMKRFGEPTASTGPLQPLLFNPATRKANSSYQGTLRPMKLGPTEVESAVALESKQSTDDIVIVEENNLLPKTSSPSLAADSMTMRSSGFQMPSGSPESRDSASSNVFRPLSATASSGGNYIATKPPTPPEQSAIANADEVAEVIEVEPDSMADSGAAPAASVTIGSESDTPKVDSNFIQASASYLRANQATNQDVDNDPKTLIPAEVFADAEQLVADVEQAMSNSTESNSFVPAPFMQPGQADAIPDATESGNDFQIQAVSSSTMISVCRSCGEETCEGCGLKQGEPMMANNDFAAPSVPDVAWKNGEMENQFVPPVSTPPAFVPAATRPDDIAVNGSFGLPFALQQPPESEGVTHRVATLPLVATDAETAAHASNVPPVGVSALMELNAVTWKSRLDQAIELAQKKLDSNQLPAAGAMVNLRLLKAVRAQMTHVENKKLSTEESRFWEHQLEAITTMLQASTDGASENSSGRESDIHRHLSAHQTLEHLREAVEQLESIANLKISGGQFCTDISGYGQFRTFPSTAFEPAQRMLVYCEVENYVSVPLESATGESFRTKLRGSFAIYDSNGNAVQQAEFPAVEDVARKKRRDFYMYLPITLGQLPAGEYEMHLLVEDIHGNKSASLDPPLKFSVAQ